MKLQKSAEKIFLKKLGARIKGIRFDKNIKIKILSEKTGLSSNFLYEIENGSRSCSAFAFYKIIQALNPAFGGTRVLVDIDRDSECIFADEEM